MNNPFKKLKTFIKKPKFGNKRGFKYHNARFWVRYDLLQSTKRFFTFLCVITIPIATISPFNFPLAITYGAVIMLLREKGIKDAGKLKMLRYI